MTEFLIFLGEGIPEGIRKRMADFIRDEKMAARGCHVADNLWAIQTHRPTQQIFDSLVSYLDDSSLKIVVAPLSGNWAERNCTSTMKCFRSDTMKKE